MCLCLGALSLNALKAQETQSTIGSGVQVDLYDNGTIAIVEAVSPELGNRVQRVRVQLPGTSAELLAKFRSKNVDFAAHTTGEDGGAVFLNLLGEQFRLYSPILVALFLSGFLHV